LNDLIEGEKTKITYKLEHVESGEITVELTAFKFGKSKEDLLKEKEKEEKEKEEKEEKKEEKKEELNITNSSTEKNLKKKSNRYLRNKILGKGGFGEIYLTDDLKYPKEKYPDRPQLCVKKIKVKTTEELTHILSEGQNTIRIKHKNLINYTDIFADQIGEELFIFFVMEYYKNGDLSKHIKNWEKKGKKLPPKKLISFLIQMLEGLCYMHTNNIIHRDLKSQNILMKDDFENLVICGIYYF
jgi:serine/threonine protein kinase